MFNFLKPYKWHYPSSEIFSNPDIEKALSYGRISETNNLVFCAGIDEAGNRVVIDLEKAPHLLVAGTTGSGKSVFINSIIYTLLFKNAPSEDIDLYLIDPKAIDFARYKEMQNGIKCHVTEEKQILETLTELNAIMDSRYTMMQSNKEYENIRNIKGAFPQIVIIFDEYSSLSSQGENKKIVNQIYSLVERIAKKGRAAGLHLIIGLQRPDSKCISGALKSNIPLRVAFHTTNKTNSYMILETRDVNAQDNVRPGEGYILNNDGSIKQFQGLYIDNDSIKNLISWWNIQPTKQSYEKTLKAFKKTL